VVQEVEQADEISALLPDAFWKSLSSADDNLHQQKTARQNQKIEDGIGLQTQVLEVPTSHWSQILRKGALEGLFTPKEMDILKIAMQIPNKIPSEKQCGVLVELLARAKEERLL
jgi:hypothetical protein